MHPLALWWLVTAVAMPTSVAGLCASAFGAALPSAAVLEVVAASCVAELAQKTALHPLDSLKVRMQYDNTQRRLAKKGGVGIVGPRLLGAEVREAWSIATRGPRPVAALYRGLGPSLLGAVRRPRVRERAVHRWARLRSSPELLHQVTRGCCTGPCARCRSTWRCPSTRPSPRS
jgi:hypothetical protein